MAHVDRDVLAVVNFALLLLILRPPRWLIDAVIAWGSEDKIRERIDAQLAAGANHVCLMPIRSDSAPLPDERALEAFAPR